MVWIWVLVVVAVLLLLWIPAGIKVISQYERGVVLRLGKFTGIKNPGLRFIIPYIDRMYRVDTRVVTMDVPAQEIITRDNVTVKVNAVVYLRVISPDAAILNVADYIRATSLISQTTLRSVVGQSELDELLAHRDMINQKLQAIVDQQTDPWGVKVSAVEVKDVELPQTMQRAMAAQAEAERERRAKIVHAEGELQAAVKLTEAARIISAESGAMQLRYLSTLRELSTERSNTIIFPLPIDLLSALSERVSRRGEKE
jgi:regulator of protease activity HflC (stomatin/prohibitin superfamily)